MNINVKDLMLGDLVFGGTHQIFLVLFGSNRGVIGDFYFLRCKLKLLDLKGI